MSSIPEWAIESARQKAIASGMPDDKFAPNGPYTGPLTEAFARYIADHEKPPVDELLIEAREIAADMMATNWIYGHAYPSSTISEVRTGLGDNCVVVQAALAALKRGIEIGKSQ